MVGFTPEGWLRRWSAETAFLIACSRNLLDHVVRDLVLADTRVTVLQRTRVEGLTGTAARVTGVLTRGQTAGKQPWKPTSSSTRAGGAHGPRSTWRSWGSDPPLSVPWTSA